MKKVLVVLVAAAAAAAGAAIIEVSDPAQLESPSPYVIGNGTLKYTGASATVENSVTLAPGNGAAATIEVADEAATLEVSGAFNSTDGAFIKTGPGTLKLTAAANQEIGRQVPSGKDANADLAWDANGAATTSFGAFNVAEGRLVIGGAGQVNNIFTWSNIGNRYQKKAYLDIVGGTTTFGSDWLNISSGNGRADNDAGSWVTIRNGSTVTIPLPRFLYRQWLGNGGSGYYGRAHMLVDGSTLKTFGSCELGAWCGEASLVITNRGCLNMVYSDDSAKTTGQGLTVGNDANHTSGDILFAVTDNSTAQIYAASVAKGTHAFIGSGARLEFSRPVLASLGTTFQGDVEIDGGTLANLSTMAWSPGSPLPWAQWFNGVTNLTVGTRGATFDVSADGVGGLGPRAVAKPGTTGGTIVKTGAGKLGLRATPLPVSVNAGELRLASPDVTFDTANAGTATFAADTTLAIAGHRSAATMDVSSAPVVKLMQAGDEGIRGAWSRNGWATVRPDGWLQLSDHSTSFGEYPIGSCFRTDKVSTTGSFVAEFGVRIRPNKGTPLNGSFAVVFQNSSAGAAAVGTKNNASTSTDAGFTGTVACNAFAVICYLDGSSADWVQFATGDASGAVTKSDPVQVTEFGPYEIMTQGYDSPFTCTLAYDAEGKKVSFTMLNTANGKTQTFAQDGVDLAAITGGEAYFGFTGTAFGQWRNTLPIVGNVRFSTTAPGLPKVERTGGCITLAGGAEKAFQLDANGAVGEGFMMKSLSYGDGSVVTADRCHIHVPGIPFVGFESYSGSGTLVKAGEADMGFDSSAARNVALQVNAGGVVLRRRDLEYPATMLDWDWQLNDRREEIRPVFGPHRGLNVGGTQIAPNNANSRRMVDVSGSWRFSFDAYPQGYYVGGATETHAGDTFGFALHDDEKGEFFVGGTGTENGSVTELKKAVGAVLGVYKWGGKNRQIFALTGNGGKATLGNNFVADSDFVNSGDRIRVELAYDASARTLTYTTRLRDLAPVVNVQENIDMATRIPSGRARIGFGAAGSSNVRIAVEFANVKFEKLDDSPLLPQETGAYLASFTANAANVPVKCDVPVAATIRLADAVAVNAGNALAVSAPHEAVTLAMGTLALDDGASLDLGENVTVAVDAVTDSRTVTVSGGVLRLTSATALTEATRLVLQDDACLDLAFTGTVKVRSIERNGVHIHSGRRSAADCDWISGPGSVDAGVGMMIYLW